MCCLGGDFYSTNEVKGTLEVNNDDKVHHLTAKWLKNSVKTAFSARTHVEQCMGKLQDVMGRQFAEWKTPMAKSAHPELDDSPLLNKWDHSKFRSLVGCTN